MTPNELYNLGYEAYEKENYSEALEYFQQLGDKSEEALSYIPMCYLSLAGEASSNASNLGDEDREGLVRGQQRAVSLFDDAIRSALRFIHKYPQNQTNCGICAMVIAQAFNLQYTLIASGLTSAYKLTTTTKTIEITIFKDLSFIEEVTNVKTESNVTLYSMDFRDYHILGPDEKELRTENSKRQIVNNVKQVASFLEFLGHEHNAHIVRASLACAMADCTNGEVEMLQSADWFICKAEELARLAFPDEEIYNEWKSVHVNTFQEYKQLESKHAPMLRYYRKEKIMPTLRVFYLDDKDVPSVDSCSGYMAVRSANEIVDAKFHKHDGANVFLSIFSHLTLKRAIPAIVFSCITSLFLGGLLSPFTNPEKAPLKVIVIVWYIITLIIVFIRSITDSNELRGKEVYIYMFCMFIVATAFSINFFLGIVVFFVLGLLSAKYK